MKRIEKFEVPAYYHTEFIDEAIGHGFSPKSKKSTQPDTYTVLITYEEDEQQECIDELNDTLAQVIEDEEFEEEEEEEDED